MNCKYTLRKTDSVPLDFIFYGCHKLEVVLIIRQELHKWDLYIQITRELLHSTPKQAYSLECG